MPRFLPVLVVLLGLAFAALGCGGDDGSSTTGAASATAGSSGSAGQTAQTPTTATASCQDVPAPSPKEGSEAAPTAKLKRGTDYVVTLQTSCGDIPILLDQGAQPLTAASFAHLVRDGFYDGLSFHRVAPGFVIQGGDPAGDGTGGPGYSIREKPPADARYTRGIVAMAKTELERRGTSGSQFFIVTADDAQLPPDYAVVGKVVGDGMATVDRIEAVPVNGQTPVKPVVIEKATVREG